MSPVAQCRNCCGTLVCKVSSAANPSRVRSATRLPHAGWITSAASSRRQAKRPLALLLHYVATWTGFVYVAFVIDAYAAGSWAGGPRARRTQASRSIIISVLNLRAA